MPGQSHLATNRDLWQGRDRNEPHREQAMADYSFDFSSLTPVERIALADMLYDSAMQEIDAMAPHLTPEQLAEIDRRIADVETGRVQLTPWEDVRAELTPNR
jgi:putative addiction module component (TIGR02574 family)